MSEPRDTIEDAGPPPDWDKPTPKVVVPPPEDAYLRGGVEVLNELFRYLQTDAWRMYDEAGTSRLITADEAATIVQELRRRVGI